jgi:hypothetical protein
MQQALPMGAPFVCQIEASGSPVVLVGDAIRNQKQEADDASAKKLLTGNRSRTKGRWSRAGEG